MNLTKENKEMRKELSSIRQSMERRNRVIEEQTYLIKEVNKVNKRQKEDDSTYHTPEKDYNIQRYTTLSCDVPRCPATPPRMKAS